MPNPVPAGTISRTDQGVDISNAPPGSPVYDPVPGVSQYVGTIQNWFNGQPYEWFKVVSGKFKGAYWYAAEQIRFRRLSRVSQGQQIGDIAQSGTGTEFGWATASGQTLAKATTGYTEGQVTKAGQAFGQQIIRDRSTSFSPTGNQAGITRPGGAGDGQQSGQGVEDIFTAYQQEIDAPRVAPPRRFISTGGSPLFAPFSWWWQSFSGRWEAEMNPPSQSNGGSTSSGGPSTSTASSSNPSVTQAQAYARSQLKKYGWSLSEMAPLIRLWNRESGWKATARNPTSGAAGIPQDITGDFHGGYQGQIDWGLNYIKQRYGSPSAAWAHEVANNWY